MDETIQSLYNLIMPISRGIKFGSYDHVPACEAWIDRTFPHFYALNYAQSGRIRWAMNSGKLITLNAPVAWWTLKGSRPRYRYGRIGVETWDHYYVSLDGPRALRFFQGLSRKDPMRPYAFIADPDSFRSRWEQLFAILRRGGQNHEAWALHEMEGLALQINQPAPFFIPSPLEARLEALGLSLRHDPAKEWSWDHEAARLGVSLVHLRRSFRKVHGAPPHHFLLKVRMESAARRLRSTMEPIKEIAESSGLPDVYHFSKQFKARFHLPPATYRREMRELYALAPKTEL
jgi:AraC-like DNA-binding protein